MLTLCAAMGEEVGELRRRMTVDEAVRRDGLCLYQGRYGEKDILLVQTGLRGAETEAAANRVLAPYPVTCLISLGFGGALAAGLRVADLVLCRKVLCQGASEIDHPCYSDQRLLSLARQVMAGRVLVGSSITVNALLAEPTEKGALGAESCVDVVDMESYWVARMASARQIPFLAVRAISDPLSQRLPPLDRFFGPHGEGLWKRAALHFSTHPADLALLPGVYWNARRARKSLTCFVDALIRSL